MKVDKYISWKEKIDPAFDDLTKVHLDYIKRTHICSIDKRKRYLSLDDESLTVLKSKGYPTLQREFKTNLKNLKKEGKRKKYLVSREGAKIAKKKTICNSQPVQIGTRPIRHVRATIIPAKRLVGQAGGDGSLKEETVGEF